MKARAAIGSVAIHALVLLAMSTPKSPMSSSALKVQTSKAPLTVLLLATPLPEISPAQKADETNTERGKTKPAAGKTVLPRLLAAVPQGQAQFRPKESASSNPDEESIPTQPVTQLNQQRQAPSGLSDPDPASIALPPTSSPVAPAKAAVTHARPDYAYNPQPEYPLLLREQGVGGVVWLRVRVSSDGQASEITLSKSSGYRLLDDAALRAVKAWRFIPAKIGENQLASWVEFPIRFTLAG